MNVSEGAKFDKTGVGVLYNKVMKGWCVHEAFRLRCRPLFGPSWKVIFKYQGIHRESFLKTDSKKA